MRNACDYRGSTKTNKVAFDSKRGSSMAPFQRTFILEVSFPFCLKMHINLTNVTWMERIAEAFKYPALECKKCALRGAEGDVMSRASVRTDCLE